MPVGKGWETFIGKRLVSKKLLLLHNLSLVVIAYAGISIIWKSAHNKVNEQAKNCLPKGLQEVFTQDATRAIYTSQSSPPDHHFNRWMMIASIVVCLQNKYKSTVLLRMWEICNWIQIYPHRLHRDFVIMQSIVSLACLPHGTSILPISDIQDNRGVSRGELWIMQVQLPRNIMSNTCAKFALAVIVRCLFLRLVHSAN